MKCPNCHKWVASFEETCHNCGFQIREKTVTEASQAAPSALVIAELRKPARAWYTNLAVLLLTIVLFLGLGTLGQPLRVTAVVVGVLLFHELGHWLAMKAFRYTDVRVFFIPLLGAAASGNPSSGSAAGRAVVDLAGPMLGVALGVGASLLYWSSRADLVKLIAQTSLVLNLFNLIPLYPLDGGRFFRDVVLIRSSVAAVIYRAFAAALFVILAIMLRSFVVGFVAVWSIAGIPWAVRAGRLAKALAPAYADSIQGPIELAPDQLLESLVQDISKGVTTGSPAEVASRTRDLWERLSTRPPGIGGSIALILLYILIVFAAIVVWALL